MTSTTTNEEFSNIVTPPDFIASRAFTILMIDPEWTEVEDVGLYLKTSKEVFTVYIYRNEMNDLKWLTEALTKAAITIVNTVDNEISPIKDKVALGKTVHYYGPKNFLMSKRKLKHPIDYFIQTESK
jgi:hypothetical protein